MGASPAQPRKQHGSRRQSRRRESGQSFIEFAFLLPIIIGMLSILIQVQMAINTAIVNQKYARNHMHFLTFNHRYYPEHRFLERANGTYMRRYWFGIEDKSTLNQVDVVPTAPIRKIGRLPGDDENQDPDTRQKVRIRVTAFMCLPPTGINFDQPFTEQNLGEEQFLDGRFPYCND